jgi:phage tail-like protein
VADHALLRILPEVFRDAADASPPLVALSAVADDLHAPVLQVLSAFDELVDPYRTPERMVGYLASWVDLDWLTVPHPDGGSRPALRNGSAPLRDLITASADLSARRGTARAMADFLTIATGSSGFVIDEVPGAFHVRVLAPHTVADQRGVVERIVATLKPAHVTAEVVLADVGPAPPSDPGPVGPADAQPTRKEENA